MAKSKKKKKQQADFKKVRLKVGRKLAKPRDTDTSFRSRKVIIQEQLKKYQQGTNDSLAESSKCLLDSVNGLCHSLHHHNKNVRKEALLSLKQRLTENSPEFTRKNFSFLIMRLGPLIYDEDYGVRQCLFPVLKILLEEVSEDEMAPFFQLFVAHLTCGLTRLDSQTKLYSLNCLELLLSNFSNLCRCSLDLLHSFLDLLAASAQNFLLGEREKVELLKHVSSFLGVMIPKKISEGSDTGKVLHINLEALERIENCKMHISLVPECQHNRNPLDFPVIYTDDKSVAAAGEGEALLSRCQHMKRCLEKVFPFLHNFWLELKTTDIFTPNSGAFGQEELNSLKKLLEVKLALLAQVRTVVGEDEASSAAEDLKNKCREIVGKKKFIECYTNTLSANSSKRAFLPINILVAKFLLLCREYLPRDAAGKWINISVCEKICRKSKLFG